MKITEAGNSKFRMLIMRMFYRQILRMYILPLLLFINTMSCGQSNTVYNKSLADHLDSILVEDQTPRQLFYGVEEKYGIKSKESIALAKTINKKDSINTIKVTAILDKYGWLGKEVVGENGNNCLYLVIQHSDLKTQEKYLPMMREAVKNGKALAADLAYLEDRVRLKQGKKQLYGSQLRRDSTTLKFYFTPIEDERNVNKRRASVGLNTIEERAREFGFEYKVPE